VRLLKSLARRLVVLLRVIEWRLMAGVAEISVGGTWIATSSRLRTAEWLRRDRRDRRRRANDAVRCRNAQRWEGIHRRRRRRLKSRGLWGGILILVEAVEVLSRGAAAAWATSTAGALRALIGGVIELAPDVLVEASWRRTIRHRRGGMGWESVMPRIQTLMLPILTPGDSFWWLEVIEIDKRATTVDEFVVVLLMIRCGLVWRYFEGG
jgi:hypothetical protein